MGKHEINLHGVSLHSVGSNSQSEYVWYILYGDVRFVCVLLCHAVLLYTRYILSNILTHHVTTVWALV